MIGCVTIFMGYKAKDVQFTYSFFTPVPDEDPEMLAYAAMAMLHGVVSMVLSNRLDKRLDKRKLIDIVLRQSMNIQSWSIY